MTISTVESLNCALRNLSNVGVKPEYFSSVSNTSAVAAVNVDVDKFNDLCHCIGADVEVEVIRDYPITRTRDVKLSLNIQDDWLLQSVLVQNIPSISIKY